MEVIQDGPHIFSYILGLAWDLLSWEMPGTAFTTKDWVLMLAIINVLFAALHFAFGLGGGSGTSYRSGDSRKKHISNERKGDER